MRKHDGFQMKCDSMSPAYLYGSKNATITYSVDTVRSATDIQCSVTRIIIVFNRPNVRMLAVVGYDLVRKIRSRATGYWARIDCSVF